MRIRSQRCKGNWDRPGRRRRGGHLKRFDGPIALLTRSNCASSCLDFADLVLSVPGAVHLGQETSSDTLYIDVAFVTLPSGNGFMMPLKVWRNRLRGNNETTLVTEMLVKRGSQVTAITPFLQYGANLGFTHLDDLLRSLPKQGLEMQTLTALTGVKDGKATLMHVYSRKASEHEFDLIVAGIHPKPQTALYEAASKICPVIVAGDAVAPRTALEAFREGDRAGRIV